MRAIPMFLLAACGPIQFGEGDDTEKPTDTGGGDTGEEGDPLDGQRPEVTGVQAADCIADVNGLDTWGVVATATDPQGVTTLGVGYVELQKDGSALGSQHSFSCTNGNCAAGWMAEEGEPCSVEGAVVVVVAVDEDGNPSYPYEVAY